MFETRENKKSGLESEARRLATEALLALDQVAFEAKRSSMMEVLRILMDEFVSCKIWMEPSIRKVRLDKRQKRMDRAESRMIKAMARGEEWRSLELKFMDFSDGIK